MIDSIRRKRSNRFDQLAAASNNAISTRPFRNRFVGWRPHRTNNSSSGTARQLNGTDPDRTRSAPNQDSLSVDFASYMDGPVRSDPGYPDTSALLHRYAFR